jgi:hypothetical protein
MKWTDNDMVQFAKICSQGSYGDYRGCKSSKQKLQRYKELQQTNVDIELQKSVHDDILVKINSNSCKPKVCRIVVDKKECIEELLLKLGYDKRSGSAAYSERLKTIVIIPAKKWYWYDTDIPRGYSMRHI